MSKSPTFDAFDEIDSLHIDADEKLRRILESRGWLHTCQTPGSFWMYQKKLDDGRTILVSEETAVMIERELCGEEYEDGLSA